MVRIGDPFLGLIVLGLLSAAPHLESIPQGSRGPTPEHHFEYSQIHMGMPVRIRLYSADETTAASAARAAFARIAALDQMMSDYRPDSELTRLEEAGEAWSVASPELFSVLQRAVEIARATDGAFDPTIGPLVRIWREARGTGRVPDRPMLDAARARVGWHRIAFDVPRRAIRLELPGMQLDLGGIAKGFILQEALTSLRAQGVRRALVEAGGDIVVGDAPPGRQGWRIDAAGARPEFIERAERLANAALATSGPTAQFLEIDGVRYSHVIDPRTGVGLTNQVTARVIAPDGATADALATALTVLGKEGAAKVLPRFPHVVASIDPS